MGKKNSRGDKPWRALGVCFCIGFSTHSIISLALIRINEETRMFCTLSGGRRALLGNEEAATQVRTLNLSCKQPRQSSFWKNFALG